MMKQRVMLACGSLVCAVVWGAWGAEVVGFSRQCDRKLWVTYRSFNKELERTGQFAEMGVTNRCIFPANTLNSGGAPYSQYPTIWHGIGNYDWSSLDVQMSDLVKASSNALVMCMIDLNTPGWGVRKFGVDSFIEVSHAAADPQWRGETKKWMCDFVSYMERKWGNRVGAYILSGGGTSEWYEYDQGRTSRKKDEAWVKWCRGRGLDFGDAVPSQPSLGKAAFENFIYDPATEREKIAYWRFHNGIIADVVLDFADAARKVIPKDKEIGVFFGYFLVSDNRQVSFGHLDYERVFASPSIDFFIAPGNYSERWIGGGSGSQLVHGTALRHGKRFLHEIDFGPHQSWWGKGDWKTLEDDLAGNTREAAFAMANNASYWWFDMWGGFYRNECVRARIAALKRAQDRIRPGCPVSEILLVVDPESLYMVNEKNVKQKAFGQHLRNNISRIGAPHDVYSFNDLPVLDLDRYKLVCLNSTLLITPEREKFLREKVCRNGRTVLWTYAPGISDGKTLDTARVRNWAGVPYGTPGLCFVEREGWSSVYAHDFSLYTVEELARIARRAGVHRYVDECAPVFAHEHFLAVHAKEGGEKRIHLHNKVKRVVDLLTDKVIAENTDSFIVQFATPDTRLWLLDDTNEGTP